MHTSRKIMSQVVNLLEVQALFVFSLVCVIITGLWRKKYLMDTRHQCYYQQY